MDTPNFKSEKNLVFFRIKILKKNLVLFRLKIRHTPSAPNTTNVTVKTDDCSLSDAAKLLYRLHTIEC